MNKKGTITRRAENNLCKLESQFKALISKEDFEFAYRELVKTGTKSDRPSKLRKLYDMFDACGIMYKRDEDNEYYRDLIQSSNITPNNKLENKMFMALYSIYQDYASPEEYMKRLVDRLEKDDWSTDTLRVRILKQFIKYGNYLSDAGYNGRLVIRKYIQDKLGHSPTDQEIIDNLDDGVFLILETATKPQRKPDGKCGLLKASDDLAFGKFHTGGSTRKLLYLFAMVYDMSYYTGNAGSGEIIDYATDIEINLFRNYYNNNLVRFITDSYKGKLDHFEKDPSGQGINYKNFAEMVYLYYIANNYTTQEKVRLSANMISEIKNSQSKKGKLDTNQKGGTVFYRNVYTEDILNKSEEEFKAFIIENYDCDTQALIGEMQLQSEQNSAFRIYKEIINDLIEEGVSLESCDYGLWFTDIAALKKGYTNTPNVSEAEQVKYDNFIDLLLAANVFLGNSKALFINSKEEVTRTLIS